LSLVILIPASIYIALQDPNLQTKLTGKIVENLSKNIKADISIGKVCYLFFNKIIINDLSITYNSNIDTLISCKKLSVSFSARDVFFRNRCNIKKISLSDGQFNLITWADKTTNVDRCFNLYKNISKDTTHIFDSKIKINDLRARNIKFTFRDFSSKAPDRHGECLSFKDLVCDISDLRVKDFKNKDKMFHGNLVNLSLVEQKSGFRIDKLSGNAKIGRRGIFIDDLYLFDSKTELRADYLKFHFNGINSFKNFVDSVKIETSLDNAFISFNTLSKLAPTLKGNSLSIYASGKIEGTISSLKTEDLTITSESGLSFISLNARISGLPDIRETMLFLDINDAETMASDISRIVSSINSNQPENLFSKLSPLIKYSFRGRVAGLFSDFVANGNLTSSIGDIYMDMLLRENRSEHGLDIEGKLLANNFNIGLLVQNSNIGKTTFRSTLSGLIRDERYGGSKFNIDSISVRRIDFKDYSYSNIYSVGSYVDNKFDGRVVCHDPNLNFIFQGIFGRSSKKDSYYDFYADVAYADLAALNLDKRDSVSVISFKTLANFTHKVDGDIIGTISAKSLEYKNRDGEFNIGDIIIQSLTNQNNFNLTLKSGFADITYKGSDFITGFVEKVLRTTVDRHIPSLLAKKEWSQNIDSSKHYQLIINTFNTKAINELLLPGLDIAEKSALLVEIDENDNLNLTLSSKELGYKGYKIQDLSLKLDSYSNNMLSDIRSSGITISNLMLDSNRIVLSASHDTLSLRTAFSNESDVKNRVLLSTRTNIRREAYSPKPIFDIYINPSRMVINNQLWSLSPSRILINNNDIQVEGFKIENDKQFFAVEGRVSDSENDSINLKINCFDISLFDAFMKKPLHFTGLFSGDVIFKEAFKKPQIQMHLNGQAVSVAKRDIGSLTMSSKWNNLEKKLDLIVFNDLNGKRTIDISGTYSPKEKYIDITGNFNNLDPGYASPVFAGIVSDITGSINGKINCKGPINKLILTSEDASVKDLSFTVDYTKARYTINGQTKLHENGLVFVNTSITDRYGSKGVINGGITYTHLRNLGFNTTIHFSNIELINLTESDNSTFYGKAFGNGYFNLRGNLKKIFMELSAQSNKNTEIHIPLSNGTEAVNSNLLKFVQNTSFTADKITIHQTQEQKEKQPSTELDIQLKLNITPNAAMFIEIDKSTGDVIKGFGNGLISMDIKPSKHIFNIQGDYLIESGSYKFVLQGIFNRDFIIQQGGTIGFNGDINKTTLNLTAKYRTKTSINTLISDTSSVSNRRTVDCLIKLTGPLMNPNIAFDIEIPDLDPITKARVDAALNTEDKVIKQVMSLLVANSFVPDIQSSVVNNSTLLYSNATEVLSNQINKIFNQLDIPLDLSFNYQPGQNGRDIFDAAVSTQLFNNRVIINGNIGNARYSNSTNEVVGDVDVEIKLDEKGKFRAKLFSHSADQFSNYLDNSQRNGGGLVYQEEFTTFKELLNSIFGNKKKRKAKNNPNNIKE